MDSPCSHSSCVLSCLKGFSHGVTYGAKIRFTNSVVIALLFKNDPWLQRIKGILKNTYQHATSLGLYVFLYKGIQCILNRSLGYKTPWNSFIAGSLAGFTIFRNQTPITSQITLYLLSRVLTGVFTLLYRKKIIPQMPVVAEHSFQIITTVCWSIVMYLFEKDRSVLQFSLKSSMSYLYDGSDQWRGFMDFVPHGDRIKDMLGISNH